MVMSEKRTRTSVSQYVCAISLAPNPIDKPAATAEIKIPLPVAESKLSVKIASSGFVVFSAVGGVTTGGVRMTTLCNPATRNFGAEMSFRNFLTCGTPQRKTSRLNDIHGTHARATWPRGCTGLGAEWTDAPPVSGKDGVSQSQPSRIAACCPSLFSLACQNFSRTASAAIDEMAPMISTSQGP